MGGALQGQWEPHRSSPPLPKLALCGDMNGKPRVHVALFGTTAGSPESDPDGEYKGNVFRKRLI